jgi:predicted HTH transcriptional regulator
MRPKEHLRSLLARLLALPKETEWVEFKHNKADPDEIGEYVSALANSAALHDEVSGYICWGVEDETHALVGTDFKLTQCKVNKQELENWLAIHLQPRIDFRFHEFEYRGKLVAMIEIPAACHLPVKFSESGFIRVGSYKKQLKEHPEKERALWAKLSRSRFETSICEPSVESDRVLSLIDYVGYFELVKQPLPDNRIGILARLCDESIINHVGEDAYDVTNLGAMLFARDLREFPTLSRKSLRVIKYSGSDRTAASREQPGRKGYAVGFAGAIRFINDLLPQNEQIGEAFRTEVPMYPSIAIRELVANAIIHQDFYMTGTGPMVEIFDDRMEITNPGTPLIDVLRFIDSPPRSRNEDLAAFMRRVGICEERGTGVDKAITAIEMFQLPPPEFVETGGQLRVTLFAPRSAGEMDQQERIRACYQHAVLRFISNKKLQNESLRKRLGISDENYPMASRVIQDTIKAGLIKPYGATGGRYARYVPVWA